MLQGFGITRVPAVIVGDQAVHGWNPQGVAALVGVDYDTSARLSPEELTQRLDTLLVAAQRAIRQIPTDQLSMKTPGRDRTIRHLSYRQRTLLDGQLEPGKYERSMEARAFDGEPTAIETGTGELGRFVYLVENRDSALAQLALNRTLWNLGNFSDYTYEFRWNCFCPREYVAPVIIEVRDGDVVSAFFTSDADMPGETDIDRYVTVEGLF